MLALFLALTSLTQPALPVQEVREASASVYLVDDAARLIPESSAVVLRIESFDAAYETFKRLYVLGDDVGEIPDKESFFSELFPIPIDIAKLDTTQPIYGAFELSMGPPLPTIVLPAKNLEELKAEVAGMGAPVAAGNYLGFAMGNPNYAVSATANPLVAELKPGVVAVHIDLEALIETFGPFIEMGLNSLEGQMANVPQDEMPIDMGAMMDFYLDGVRTVLDSAEGMDMALQDDGNRMVLDGVFTALEGSVLEDFYTPGEFSTDVLQGALDPSQPLSFFAAADWKAVSEKMLPMMDALMGVYPEPMRDGFRSYMDVFMGSYEHMGDVAVGNGGFGADGMEFAYYVTSAEPASLVQAMRTAFEGGSLTEMGMEVSPAAELEVGGSKVLQWLMKFDMESMMSNMGATTEELSSEDMAAMSQMMDAIYGENMTLSIAEKEGRVAILMGPDENKTAANVARLSAPLAPASGDFARALGTLRGAKPVMVYRMDLPRLMNQFRTLIPEMAEEVPEFPADPCAITSWFGIRERDWMSGLSIDYGELKRLVESLRGM